MISSEVQRTLVKSPPELWAELSDPASLARHLGEFGEIRITHIEPEQVVEWEAAAASGKVLIKASGWGTKVTLTVLREPPECDPAVPEEPSPQTAPTPIADPVATDPVAIEPEAIEPPAIEPEPIAEPQPPVPAGEPRRGLLSRLFGRGRRDRSAERTVAAEAPELSQAEAVPLQPIAAGAPGPSQTEAASVDESQDGSPEADDAPDISAELRAAEEVAVEEVTAVLTSVLDRLGAAHHRPFSRA